MVVLATWQVIYPGKRFGSLFRRRKVPAQTLYVENSLVLATWQVIYSGNRFGSLYKPRIACTVQLMNMFGIALAITVFLFKLKNFRQLILHYVTSHI